MLVSVYLIEMHIIQLFNKMTCDTSLNELVEDEISSLFSFSHTMLLMYDNRRILMIKSRGQTQDSRFIKTHKD